MFALRISSAASYISSKSGLSESREFPESRKIPDSWISTSGESLLYTAVRNSNFHMTELILGFGPQLVDEKSKDVSLLHIAAFNGLHFQWIFIENNWIQII